MNEEGGLRGIGKHGDSRYEEADDAPDIEDVYQQPQPAVRDGLRVVRPDLGPWEEILPTVDLLRRVDQHAIVPRRHAPQRQDHGPRIQLPQMRLPRPRYFLKLRPLHKGYLDLFPLSTAPRPDRFAAHHCWCSRAFAYLDGVVYP